MPTGKEIFCELIMNQNNNNWTEEEMRQWMCNLICNLTDEDMQFTRDSMNRLLQLNCLESEELFMNYRRPFFYRPFFCVDCGEHMSDPNMCTECDPIVARRPVYLTELTKTVEEREYHKWLQRVSLPSADDLD